MNMKKYSKGLFFLFFVVAFGACVEFDSSYTETVFVDEPDLDPNAENYAFEKWLEDSYLIPYNLEFRYRMQDVGSNTDYNLIPTKLQKSEEMAILVKYLWFDVYGEVVDSVFLKKYGPRIIHLIGSAAYNPNFGTKILGTAEGGIKVTLFDCNRLDPGNLRFNNKYYFHTMHHEFAHILHQQKTFPKEFEKLSAGYYDPMYWQERSDDNEDAKSESQIDHTQYAPLGFVSAYASGQAREDFVEVISYYITGSDAWWAKLYIDAAKPGPNGEPTVNGKTGKEIIEAKVEICRKWLKDAWKIDLDSMRNNVRERQLHVDEALAKGFEEIEKYKNNNDQ
jgi:substrate import-associated zinc metallohydrolase lipoprotein